ncbi:MAG: hypothetical protein ACREU6_09005 [Steroidobacteraceae bacterium]
MVKSLALGIFVTVAALQLAQIARAESQVQQGPATAKSGATARVEFKIVIPTILYLRMEQNVDRDGRSTRAVVVSNSRDVMVNASIEALNVDSVHAMANRRTGTTADPRTVPASSARSTPSNNTDGHVILTAPFSKSIVQSTKCELKETDDVSYVKDRRRIDTKGGGRITCTVAIP